MVVFQGHYSACTDCFCVHMNWLDDMTEHAVDACDTALRRKAGKGYWQEGATDCDEEFSWQSCEVCGSHLGGQRHTLSLMEVI